RDSSLRYRFVQTDSRGVIPPTGSISLLENKVLSIDRNLSEVSTASTTEKPYYVMTVTEPRRSAVIKHDIATSLEILHSATASFRMTKDLTFRRKEESQKRFNKIINKIGCWTKSSMTKQ